MKIKGMVGSEMPVKLVVKVPCAVIEHEGKVLAAQRSATLSLPLKWEFPGGKLEEDETEEEALNREILEELNVEVEIGVRLPLSIRDDGWREIQLVPFVCQLLTFDIQLIDHEEIRWLTPDQMYDLDWAEADYAIIENYLAYLESQKQNQ
ncbi:(deoxy)nucleoside triphosphate pyrophosphohydrolase [Telluribacter sp. SYSU D00476]|uniref:(deoxy)nucleoside triphosphate pyrophosphohydrolase n=1 Tax=Telluribacter sp. SYSU D00476 TaxID=2811430 RepID=UPI001FF5D6EE|nr:NUDIX domain-containing protein [Telluribacter sp. SYSU D00476]